MKENSQKIKKPWAVYSYAGPLGIARVVKDGESFVELRYSEGQLFPLHLWSSNPSYIKRFEIVDDAIDYFLEKDHQYSRKRLEIKVREDFPSLFPKTVSKHTNS
ncbi:MAG TPA: hypothetical protein VMZ91_11600 [Candidatus Paceibacterota bacterium]|nr:hypothetical protein [Candidatus Paceibacterota bacterium]